jgi:hypothetical protein
MFFKNKTFITEEIYFCFSFKLYEIELNSYEVKEYS